jgi:hypothetical protein
MLERLALRDLCEVGRADVESVGLSISVHRRVLGSKEWKWVTDLAENLTE